MIAMNKIPLALITGATSGIGLALTKMLLEKNYQVILVGRSAEKLQQVRTQLHNINIINCLCVDLAQPNAAHTVFNTCVEKTYYVDLLVNNAGVGVFGEFTEEPLTKTTNMLNLNITTLTELCHLFAKQMCQRQYGKILNIASTAAFQPVPYLASYAASKSYVLHFSEALNAELRQKNVKVYCLCPGATATNFMDIAGINQQEQGVFAKQALMNVEDVAKRAWRLINSNQAYTIVGFKNHLLAFLNRFTPRAVVTYFSHLMFKSMLKNK